MFAHVAVSKGPMSNALTVRLLDHDRVTVTHKERLGKTNKPIPSEMQQAALLAYIWYFGCFVAVPLLVPAGIRHTYTHKVVRGVAYMTSLTHIAMVKYERRKETRKKESKPNMSFVIFLFLYPSPAPLVAVPWRWATLRLYFLARPMEIMIFRRTKW